MSPKRKKKRSKRSTLNTFIFYPKTLLNHIPHVKYATGAIASATFLAFFIIWAIPFLEKETSASTSIEHPYFVFPSWNDELSSDWRDAIKDEISEKIINTNYKNMPLNEYLKNIHSTIEALGVCKKIHQVKKIEDNLIEIRATMHLPWATSKRDGILSYITRDGILLPNLNANPFEKEKQYHLIKINSPLKTAPKLGQLWQGEDIKNGLNLINLFYAQEWGNQITEIDLQGFPESNELIFYTKKNKKFIWGSPIGKEKVGERISKGKIHYLNELYNQYKKRIDGSAHATINLMLPTGAIAEENL